jgi:hypothetical protein
MIVNSITPQFGENYAEGYIGFTYVGGRLSEGIAYFERWERLSDIRVSHTFVVSGPNECIEAHIDTGVARSTLSKYFDDPNTQVFFRKPIGLTVNTAGEIAEAAESKIGCRYDTGLIFADGLADTFLGHWLNKIFRQWPARIVSAIVARLTGTQMICSELVAYALAQLPEYKNTGILRQPLFTIDPQALFEDQTIFETWVNQSGHGATLQKL